MNCKNNNDNLQKVFFVATNGSDKNGDGTIDKPFLSIAAAQKAVRAVIVSGKLDGDVHVFVRGGTYYIDSPVVIGASDCHSVYKVIYSNYEDEDVRLVGGVPVTEWTDAGEGIFKADVSKLPSFYTMFENGVRLTNAREVNWKNVSVQDPSHLQVVYGSVTSWFGEILKIESIENEEIKTTYQKCPFSGGLQYLQGAREYISDPGEWAIEGSYVYYKPIDSNAIEGKEIIAGTSEHIFLIEGDAELPVKNITVRGFRMEMNAFGENLIAHARPQNVMFEFDSNLAGLVCIHNAENVSVERCHMTNAGYMAVVLKGYAQNNTVYGNYISRTGYAGIFLIGENFGSLNYCNKLNTISQNRIVKVGEFVGHGAGIYLLNSGENRITNNTISDVPRYGISMKGVRFGVFGDNDLGDVPFEDHWKYNQTTGNYIGYNKISNTGCRSGDGGGVEGWGIGRYNHIDNNIIFNAYRGVATKGWRGHSVFLDDATHYTKVTNNIIYDDSAVAGNAGTFIKSIENYVVNNVFDVSYEVDGAANISPYVCPAGDSTFKHNVVYAHAVGTLNRDGTLTDGGDNERVMVHFAQNKGCDIVPALESLKEMDENVYFNALGPTLIQVNDQFLTVDEWKSNEENVKGYDANSICADPLFVDAENHDYRLREDSPARKLGIESIETENIGCSDYWKE